MTEWKIAEKYHARWLESLLQRAQEEMWNIENSQAKSAGISTDGQVGLLEVRWIANGTNTIDANWDINIGGHLPMRPDWKVDVDYKKLDGIGTFLFKQNSETRESQ